MSEEMNIMQKNLFLRIMGESSVQFNRLRSRHRPRRNPRCKCKVSNSDYHTTLKPQH